MLTPEKIIQSLSKFCDPVPEDLVKHFNNDLMPSNTSSAINLLSLSEALEYTKGVHNYAILGKRLGLIALDDANNSNPYCYITRGPASDCILYLQHDDSPVVAYSSLKTFISEINRAVSNGTHIEHIDHEKGIYRSSVVDRIPHLLESDEDIVEACLLISLVPINNLPFLEKLSDHSDFYIREAIGLHLAENPNIRMFDLAKALSIDSCPQVAFAGKRALTLIESIKMDNKSQ